MAAGKFNFSDKKQALLQRMLAEEGIKTTKPQRIPKRVDGDIYPVSFAQTRLWFLDQLESENAFYNLTKALHLRGALDVDCLIRSINEILRRHEPLSTRFSTEEGTPILSHNADMALEIPIVDLEDYPEEARAEQAQKLAIDEAQTPFDLARDLLLRATILRNNPHDHTLLLTMHHIASDGWSFVIFVRELEALYRAYSAGEDSPLADLDIQYADFAAWQQQRFQGEVYENQLGY